MSLRFEWDPRKAQTNQNKHDVSFEEALTVFADPLARIFPDDEHSVDELREIIIGYSARHQLILVNLTGIEQTGANFQRTQGYAPGVQRL
jgi:uncharacterized protein